jgi:hypothetical protein
MLVLHFTVCFENRAAKHRATMLTPSTMKASTAAEA